MNKKEIEKLAPAKNWNSAEGYKWILVKHKKGYYYWIWAIPNK